MKIKNDWENKVWGQKKIRDKKKYVIRETDNQE